VAVVEVAAVEVAAVEVAAVEVVVGAAVVVFARIHLTWQENYVLAAC
jgi:hypothetical protein